MTIQQYFHSCAPVEEEQIRDSTETPDEPLLEEICSAPPNETLISKPVVSPEQNGTLAPTPRKRKKIRKIRGLVIGKLTGFNEKGQLLVEFPGSPKKRWLAAGTTVGWTTGDLGKDVVLMFERGHPRKPIIMGILQSPQPGRIPTAPSVQVDLDGNRLFLAAEQEITLRCGKASLTLTRAGKVLVKGTYVSSRASGVNRIKGGAVQIN